MRVPGAALLAPLLLLPLAGCLQGDTGTTTTFDATCPNWTVADHPLLTLNDAQLYQQKGSPTTRTNSDTMPFSNGKGPALPPPDDNGKKADRYQLRAPGQGGGPIHVENGTLTFRVFRNDTGEQLAISDADHPDQSKMEWSFPPAYTGPANLLVSLVSPTKEPSPAAIRIEATFTALPGFVIGTTSPRAGAQYSLSPFVHYRAPGCLQK